ncbi:hypothetical protein [Usitatibacter palustris]|uniref:hypothetical protein n=1 Tax=Usitatibacter palustris TaxID=2732487 RepID=UPI001488E12F|nr:hypothetical protein [Usitatibacter palustris]
MAVANVIQRCLLASLLMAMTCAEAQTVCPQRELTKTEVLIKALEALKARGIGLVSYDNLYVRFERDGCGYRVVIRDDPPKPSGVMSVELAPDGQLRRINLD